MANLSEKDVLTVPCRIAFPALFEPKPVVKGEDKKAYQAVLLLPPDTDLKPFYAAIKAAMIEKWGKVIQMSSRANPLKKCDSKDNPPMGYDPGWYYLNTRSNYQPSVVDRSLREVMDPGLVYGGCWCRFHLSAFAWEHPVGGKGVSFSLNSVQFVKDDQRFDGRRDATEVFQPLDEIAGDDEASPFGGSDEDIPF